MVSAPVKIGCCHEDVVVGTEDVDNCTSCHHSSPPASSADGAAAGCFLHFGSELCGCLWVHFFVFDCVFCRGGSPVNGLVGRGALRSFKSEDTWYLMSSSSSRLTGYDGMVTFLVADADVPVGHELPCLLHGCCKSLVVDLCLKSAVEDVLGAERKNVVEGRI